MNIGIKYCGGCNPRYNRRNFIEGLKSRYGKSVNLGTVQKDIQYDLILVVCGCSSCCAKIEGREEKEQVILVACQEEFSIVYEMIDKFISEE